jgi:ABC-type polysaccharide/polyol phosphate export permease
MNTKITNYWCALAHYFQPDLFWQLLRSKCTNVRATLTDKFINFYIWAGCSLLVSGYLMQAFGLSKSFGAFQLGGILASVGLFELYGNAVTIVSDIEGDCTIAYYLSLPSSALTVLASSVCYYTAIGTSMSIILLPLAKLILGAQLTFAHTAWFSLFFFILLINLVCATATLLLSAFVPSMDKFDIIWIRIIFPLWFLGGFQFSWTSVKAVAPWFSYALLLNPVTYANEGIRAALLGQEGNLPFLLCCTALLLLWGIIIRWAYGALKKRLDFV